MILDNYATYITYKFTDILEELHNQIPELRNMDVCVAGGSVTRHIHNEELELSQDIDIFCYGDSADYSEFIKHKEINNIIGPYGVTTHLHNSQIRVQFVKKTYDNIEDILEGFDLECCQNAYDLKTRSVISLNYNKDKKYNINLSKITGLTAKRIIKYLSRGFIPQNFNEYVDILFQDPYREFDEFYANIKITSIKSIVDLLTHHENAYILSKFDNMNIKDYMELCDFEAMLPHANIHPINILRAYLLGKTWHMSKESMKILEEKYIEYLI